MPASRSLEPILYEHAAFLAGLTPYEASRTAEALFQAHHAGWRTYGHAKITVGIDLYNLEPEAWGVPVPSPSGTAIPCLADPLVDNIEGLAELPPLDPRSQGRLGMAIEAAVRIRETCAPARVLVPVCGPFALAAGLMGLENLLCAAFEDPGAASIWLLAIAPRAGTLSQGHRRGRPGHCHLRIRRRPADVVARDVSPGRSAGAPGTDRGLHASHRRGARLHYRRPERDHCRGHRPVFSCPDDLSFRSGSGGLRGGGQGFSRRGSARQHAAHESGPVGTRKRSAGNTSAPQPLPPNIPARWWEAGFSPTIPPPSRCGRSCTGWPGRWNVESIHLPPVAHPFTSRTCEKCCSKKHLTSYFGSL